MMAGTGVSVGGGVGMLRTRRRDVSVKPNRKLDRKSSRGMIYENEELRLRTIHINAEVEQGQNDIKKLRRENEQLRREIWSLRDEYDKLEEILKRQKSRGESEEYEDRSEEDDGLRSEYSCEEDEEEVDEEAEDDEGSTKPDDEDEDNERDEQDDKDDDNDDREERLENAENQKISTEKMSGHRLHVDFDDLSVVEEEEEGARRREGGEERRDGRRGQRRQLQDNFPFYPSSYDTSGTFGASAYYPDCPFEFPNAIDPAGLISSATCPGLYGDQLTSGLAGLDVTDSAQNCPSIDNGPPIEPIPSLVRVPPVGWQNNVLLPGNPTRNCSPLEGNFAPGSPPARIPRIDATDLRAMPIAENRVKLQSYGTLGTAASLSRAPNLLQRRNVALRQPMKFPAANPFKESRLPGSPTDPQTIRSIWRVGGDLGGERNGSNDRETAMDVPSSLLAASERPKHFFAPLPSKVKSSKAEEHSPEIGNQLFGTANSSSSGKTDSTVICRDKGSVDVCVNGAVAYQTEPLTTRDDQRTFLSTENLLIDDVRPNLAETQLTKSLSCQNLTMDTQPQQLRAEGKPSGLTKSDNTLDSIANDDSSRPYKSHLNVTLKTPRRSKRSSSPEIPEIPQLPSMDYRVLRNPFLRNYVDTPSTKPLSIQVHENNPAYQYSNPGTMSTFGRGIHKPLGPTEQNRLLIPTDQLINGKLLSPLTKQDIQVTSFERPSPHTLIPPSTPYDLETLRRITTNRFLAGPNLYQDVPYVPGRAYVCPTSVNAPRLYYDGASSSKVPAQTQTSIDGDSRPDDETRPDRQQTDGNVSETESPSDQRRRRKDGRREKTRDHATTLSPSAQRRLKKQISTTSAEGSIPESPGKSSRVKSRKSSVADASEEKNESRSSSSGQDSPRKEQTRRVSVYFNASKKRPSLASVRTARSGSLDATREKSARDPTNDDLADRDRANSLSSRDNGKPRKTSTSSGNVPWCACWGNGCV